MSKKSSKNKDEVQPLVTTKAELHKVVKGEAKELVAAKTEKRRAQITPPPPPMIKIGEVANPIIGNRGLKRALAVAIVHQCTTDKKVDEMRAGLLIRASGILYKAGFTEEAATDKLASNEWSGKSYARFVTNTPEGKNYNTKFPEKVEKCVAFAKAIYDATKDDAKKAEVEVVKEEVKAAEPAKIEEAKPEVVAASN